MTVGFPSEPNFFLTIPPILASRSAKTSGAGTRTETMKRRITRTIVETHEVIRVTAEEPPILARCPECEMETGFVRPEIAAREAEISQRELFRRIEAGRIHHLERPDGGILVCAVSAANSNTEINP